MSTPLAVTPSDGGKASAGNPPVEVTIFGPDGEGGWEPVDLGGGDVQTVAGVAPDGDGNVALTHADLGPIEVADLGFDPETQEEWDAASTTINAELVKKALAKPKLYVKGLGQVTSVVSLGHSLLSGLTLSDPPTKRPTAQLAALTTGVLDDQNIAASGSDLTDALPSGAGWGRLWASLDLTSSATVPPSLAILWSGLNGISQAFTSTTTPGSIGDQVRESVISYLRGRPGSYKRISHSSFAYGPGWQDGAVNDGVGQQPTKVASAVDQYVTETVTMAEAGTHVVAFMRVPAYGVGERWEVREGGTLLAAATFSEAADSRAVPAVLRIPNLSAGAHTLTITCKALASGVPIAFFLGSWDERSYPPVVLDTLQYKVADYSVVFAGQPHVPTDADVDTLNTRIRAVDGLFDDYVISVSTERILERSKGRLATDGVHLTDGSSQLPALAWLKALLTSPVTSTNPL